MCQSNIGALLKGDKHIDEVLSFDKFRKGDIIKKMRTRRFDLGILLTNSFSSAWLFYRGGVENRIGYAGDFRGILLNKSILRSSDAGKCHFVDTYKQILAPLGIEHSETRPVLHIQDDEIDSADALLRRYSVTEGSVVVGINPGAAYGSAKCWILDRYRDVADRLLANPLVHVIFFGDKSGVALVNTICEGLSERAINIAGQTSLREFMALMSQCDVFLTNDSGPMHIAAALRVPLVAIFGSTNDIATGPYEFGTVIHKHVDCSPCYCRECPRDFRCMTSISVDEVYDAVCQELSNKL